MNIEPIAVYSGNIVIYWSGIVIALGIAAGFMLANAIYTSHHGRSSALWVMLPFAMVLSIFFCRILHWYCHEEQYVSLYRAITDYSGGSYCLPGALLGVYLGALISTKLGFADSVGKILDAVAPGFSLTIALIRLSSLFNSSCHSKYVIEKNFFKRLPFGAPLIDSAGNADWRFATFFVEFLLMLLVMGLLIFIYYHLHNSRMNPPCRRNGNVFRLFLVLYGAITLVLDSTRNDSSFLHFPGVLKVLNKFAGFVSMAQLVAALCILFVIVYYSKCSRKSGSKAKRWLIWVGYIISLAMVGGCEYCVQRWSNLYRLCYLGMSFGVILMSLMAFLMYKTCIRTINDIEDEYE